MIRQIEDWTPQGTSGHEGVDALLQTFRQHLHNQIQHRSLIAHSRRLGIRCSVVPVDRMVLRRGDVEEIMVDPPQRFTAGLRSGDEWEAAIPVACCNRRTILRGLRVYFHHEDTSFTHELFLDGSQNLTFVHKPPIAATDHESDLLFAGWALGVTASALRIAAASADASGRAATEFCVEVQVCMTGGGDQVRAATERRLLDYRFESMTTTFPRYTFDVDEGPIGVLNSLLEDLYRSAGLGHGNPVISVRRTQIDCVTGR
jgi:hypothetical protein